jgi:DNA-binding NarL/FixJ family response regulator
MVTETQITQVLIADEHAVVRAGLRAVLAQLPNFAVVDEAQDCASTVHAVNRQLPDMVIMDLATQGTSSLDAIADIKRRHPDTRVLMLTGNRSRDHVVATLRAGVKGYVLKEASIPELLSALACVRKGHTYLSPEIAGFVIGAYFDQAPGTAAGVAPTTLSQREAQVLKLVATGNTSKQIADHLFISPRTVEKHRARVMHKLNLKTMAALLTFAIGNNFVDEAQAAMGFTERLQQSSDPIVCQKPDRYL